MDSVTILLSGLSSLLTGILLYKFRERNEADKKALEEQRKKQGALAMGVVAMLRDRLIDTMDYHIKVGWVAVEKADVVTRMFLAYHNLGGNDVVSHSYQRFMDLPHCECRAERSDADVRVRKD